MTTAPTWRAFLDDQFPGYLLPESALHAITAEQAAKFLSALSGRPDQLEIVRASTTLAPHGEALALFVHEELQDLVRALPKRSEVLTRTWTGGFHGRLDVVRTSVLHSQGHADSFVTRSRRFSFELPENVLVRAVAEKLLSALTLLRRAGALGDTGWSAALRGAEGTLRRLLLASALRDVPLALPGVFEEQAALAARHRAYRSAVKWLRVLREGLDSDNPETIARLVAVGALEPLEDYTQFEIAVLLRLTQTLHTGLESREQGRWAIERTLILPDREEVVVLRRDDGACVRIIYNRAELPAGACDLGIKHYLGSAGRMRPDITVVIDPGSGAPSRATVFEVKLSESVSYLATGFQQAMTYRWEYGEALAGWPKAVLVVPGAVMGAPRPDDDVVAVGWADWISESLVSGLLRELTA